MDKTEIRHLLLAAKIAKQRKNGREVNKIQLALVEPIRGNLEAVNAVDTAYIEWIDTRPSNVPTSLVEEIYRWVK